jgi:hypothetical protein
MAGPSAIPRDKITRENAASTIWRCGKTHYPVFHEISLAGFDSLDGDGLR